jgi:hypothetical protein
VHARALLTSTLEGSSRYIQADLSEPDEIMNSREVRETFDLSRPVALCLLTVIHFIQDDDEALRIVRRLMDPLPSGSYLALSTINIESAAGPVRAAVKKHNEHGIKSKGRTTAQITGFFDGLELTDPGVVPVHHWRPDDEAREVDDTQVSIYGGLARKP